MKPDLDRRRALLAAAVSLAIGAATGRFLLNSMNAADPRVLGILAANADPPEWLESGVALDDVEPPAPSGAREALARAPASAPDHLVIVLIDGLGEAPFAEAIEGTALAAFDWKATVDCGTPSLSRPIYHVLLTGVPQSVSGIRNNTHQGRARADDLAAKVRASGGSVGWALETVPWFFDLFGSRDDAYERLGDEPLWNPVTDRFDPPSPPWRDRYTKMASVLSTLPRLAVLHFIGVDHAGHHRGAQSPEYRAAAREAVLAVAALRDEQARSPGASPTVWMIGADHGHLRGGGHGGPEPEVTRTTWIGLWPSGSAENGSLQRPHLEIPRVVPFERLATTFAALLKVPPPQNAMGEPLPLPDRPVAASSQLSARSMAVREAVSEADRAAHRAVLVRAAALALGLVALVLALLRGPFHRRTPAGETERSATTENATTENATTENTIGRRERALALAGAALPVIAAAFGFWALGPGLTLSAIRTHFAFMSRSLAATALGAAATYPLVIRWRTPATWVAVAAGVVPAAAYAITAGSMGASRLPDSLLLLVPATGLLPWGIILGLGVTHVLRNRRNGSNPDLRNS